MKSKYFTSFYLVFRWIQNSVPTLRDLTFEASAIWGPDIYRSDICGISMRRWRDPDFC